VPTGLFDERIAARSETHWPDLFQPAAIDPAFSSPHRYVWPSELDLMARLAGMTLRERWSGWRREPFTSDSKAHVSVWEKTGRDRRNGRRGHSLDPQIR
jgi:hypothetical protein